MFFMEKFHSFLSKPEAFDITTRPVFLRNNNALEHGERHLLSLLPHP